MLLQCDNIGCEKGQKLGYFNLPQTQVVGGLIFDAKLTKNINNVWGSRDLGQSVLEDKAN